MQYFIYIHVYAVLKIIKISKCLHIFSQSDNQMCSLELFTTQFIHFTWFYYEALFQTF